MLNLMLDRLRIACAITCGGFAWIIVDIVSK